MFDHKYVFVYNTIFRQRISLQIVNIARRKPLHCLQERMLPRITYFNDMAPLFIQKQQNVHDCKVCFDKNDILGLNTSGNTNIRLGPKNLWSDEQRVFFLQTKNRGFTTTVHQVLLVLVVIKFSSVSCYLLPCIGSPKMLTQWRAFR